MKPLFYFLIVLFVLSCRNDGNETVSNKDLIGNWTWIKSTGGIDGSTQTPESTSKTVQLVITDSTVKIYENEDLISENSYEIQMKESVLGGNKPILIYDSDKTSQSFSVQGTKLYLNDECYDCYSSEYEKN